MSAQHVCDKVLSSFLILILKTSAETSVFRFTKCQCCVGLPLNVISGFDTDVYRRKPIN